MTSAAELSLAAIDLGASSGRVIVGRVSANRLELVTAHRFANEPVWSGDSLRWNIKDLFAQSLVGLRRAARSDELSSVGVDSWAVDYALLDESGALLGAPVHYRDARTRGAKARLEGLVSPEELYFATGVQPMEINTVYQLASENPEILAAAEHLLLIPDLMCYWLTAAIGAEITNASTTGLFDTTAMQWTTAIARQLAIPARILPPTREPGALIGSVQSQAREQTGLRCAVVAVGSHDTASAVVAVPAEAGQEFAYISSGTWSLVGAELERPITTTAAFAAGFTNEIGVDGRVRFLRNVMGLWILQEAMREWQTSDLAGLLSEASAATPFGSLIDPDDPSFLPPGDMSARVADFCRVTGQPPPSSKGAAVRCILESLALTYRRTLRDLQNLTSRRVDLIHVIGGGSQNSVLCQWTADACNRPVVAGPVEASAIGNVLVQARALDVGFADLESMRALVRSTQPLARYEPRDRGEAWESAERRVFARG